MSRAVANLLLPAARPASTIARPRPRELPVTNHICAIHRALSSHPKYSGKAYQTQDWMRARSCTAERARTSSSEIPRSDVYLHDQSVRVWDQLARSNGGRRRMAISKDTTADQGGKKVVHKL